MSESLENSGKKKILNSTLLRKQVLNSVLNKQIETHKNVLKTIKVCDDLGIKCFCVNCYNENVKASLKEIFKGLYVDGRDVNDWPISWKLSELADLGMRGGSEGYANIRANSLTTGYYYKENNNWFIETKLDLVNVSLSKTEHKRNFLIKDSFLKTYNFKECRVEIVESKVILRLYFVDKIYSFELGSIEKYSNCSINTDILNLIENIESIDFKVLIKDNCLVKFECI